MKNFTGKLNTTLKVLLVGSGLSAAKYHEYDYKKNGWTVIAVNHGFHVVKNFDYVFFAGDVRRALNDAGYPDSDPRLVVIKSITVVEPYGTLDECGRGIMLNSSYHLLTVLGRPKLVGYLGADMNYTPDKNGNTCIYGVGNDVKHKKVPDPDRIIAWVGGNKKYFTEKFLQYQEYASCPCYNFSDDPDTRLPFPQVRPEDVE